MYQKWTSLGLDCQTNETFIWRIHIPLTILHIVGFIHVKNKLEKKLESMANAKELHVPEAVVPITRYPIWFGGSASSMAVFVTHPIELGKQQISNHGLNQELTKYLHCSQGRNITLIPDYVFR